MTIVIIRSTGSGIVVNLIVEMAESIENKGFYRTQSKMATELIVEHRLISFHSFNQIQ